MTSTQYWWLALGLGLVVAVVAVILLQVFLRQVWRVERAAEQVWAAGKQVAANTSTTWVLGATADRLDDFIDEAGRHGELLSGGTRPEGSVR
jgi:pyruvate dehydrogenase complex dehydrogenase (E1) component